MSRRGREKNRRDLVRLKSEAGALHQAGRLEEAAQRYRAILDSDPRDFDLLHRFGVLRAQQGRFDEAADLLRQALAQNPSAAPAHNNLGMTLNLCGRYSDALPVLERALALTPQDAIAYNNLGISLRGLGRQSAALSAFERAAALNPDYTEALINLGGALQALARNEEAIAVLKRAIALRPALPSALLNLGAAQRALSHRPEAISSFERALAIDPHHVLAHEQLGNMQLEMGRFDAARGCYRRALEIQPTNCRLLLNLVQASKLHPGDPVLGTLEAIADKKASLAADQRIALHFALAKAYADLGENERAFAQYLEGNGLRRRHIAYDVDADIDLFERIRDVFSTDFLQRRGGVGHPSHRPIFIVGMMRSGSTLVEQILASHPDVFGAGERPDFNDAYKDLRQGLPSQAHYPESIRDFIPQQFLALGGRYLERLKAFAGDRLASRITDKMPGNFSAIGLIHLALPNARIIHTLRDPVDTCLSCFSKLFTENQPFTYDLGELGRYYHAYQRLMAHWRAVLPEGVLLDVRYEDVVTNLEGQARKIVEFCGLEWDDNCLSFHETERPIHTASQVQVRQPLYQTSMNRWRPSPELLRPLLEGLRGIAAETN